MKLEIHPGILHIFGQLTILTLLALNVLGHCDGSWWFLVDPHHGYWWIKMMDPSGSTWWILVDPCDEFWWIHVIDPGGSTWWMLVDPLVGSW